MEKVNIESQLKEIKIKFKNLESARQDKVQERKKIDQHLAEIREEQLRLQGEYRVFENMLNPKVDGQTEPKNLKTPEIMQKGTSTKKTN